MKISFVLFLTTAFAVRHFSLNAIEPLSASSDDDDSTSPSISSACVQNPDWTPPSPDACQETCRFAEPINYLAYRLTIDGSCPSQRSLFDCPNQPPLCDNADSCESAWSEWSSCDSTCGGGIQSRARNLTSDCLLTCYPCSTQWQSCNTAPCGYDCQFIDEWGPWSVCTSSCYNATDFLLPQQTRFRGIVQGVSPGVLCTPDQYIQTQTCPGLSLCPINCELSPWAPWTECNVPCGCGTQTRERDILVVPSDDGVQCDSLTQVQTCQCAKCPQACEISEWSFGPCMGDCATNISGFLEYPTRSRTRYVIQEAIPFVAPDGCATPCELSSVQVCDWLPVCPSSCQLSQWSTWSGNCSGCVPYGEPIPTQERFRSVTTIGGGQCGCTKDIRVCDLMWCCEDCEVSEWTGWSTCTPTAQCSNGFASGVQTRSRSVENPPNPCGAVCPILTDSKLCTACCPIDCQVGDWVITTICGQTLSNGTTVEIPCGPTQGTRVYERTLTPGNSCGAPCPNNTIQTESCYPIAPCCPQDCELSEWTFSECFGCGKLSIAWKSRQITQTPACGGEPCCDIDCAKFLEIPCPQPQPCPQEQCIYGSYGDWSPCPATCQAVGQPPNTQCRFALLASGPSSCPGNLTNCVECGSGCCPSDCEVGAWQDWGACTPSCGEGLQSRVRSIVNASSCGGASCPSLKVFQSCQTEPCPVNCVVSEWSSWSLCPSCLPAPPLPGSGAVNQQRSRTILLQPSGAGLNCPSPLTDSKPCNVPICDQDCAVGAWGAWSSCSVACGDGFQTRSRTVVQNQYGQGMACPLLTATQWCYNSCPHCIYGPPTDGPCSATCHDPGMPPAYFIRSYQTLITAAPPASNATLNGSSNGNSTSNGTIVFEACPQQNEQVPCLSLPCCPFDCVVSTWGPWGECIDGVRNRTRTVITQASCNGVPCPTCFLEKDNCLYVPPPNECEYGQACEEGFSTDVA